MADFQPQRWFAQSQIARLATVTGDHGSPHLVPIVFALRDEVIYTAVDAKRKTTTRLRRLTNIGNNPRVSVLVDHYADDWTQLWWVRADGMATIHRDGPEMHQGYQLLRAKYPQYEAVGLDGPVIAIAVDHWSRWQA